MNRAKLKQQIGHLIITGWETPEPSAAFLKFIAENFIGGVILFDEQCSSPDLLRSSLETIRAGADFEPFVAIDQEGGRVC